MATIGLCIISKEYDDDIRRIIRDYANYFDQIYIQINGSGIVPASKNKIHFSQFKWTNDFAKARNAVLKEVTTDYWFWLDTDDSIENPENIENIVRTMESNSIDIMYLRYITAYNAIGEPISMLLRERIIRTALNLKWNGACHETVSLRSRLKILMDLGVTIKHADKTQAMNTASSKRNLKILLNEYAKGNRKAMTLLYIAAEYNVLKNLTGADKYYNRALIATRRKIIKYSILSELSKLYIDMKKINKSLNALKQAIKLCPDWGDAFIDLGIKTLKFKPTEKKAAINYIETGLGKEMTVYGPQNPQFHNYIPYWALATAYLELNDLDKAKLNIEIAMRFENVPPQLITTNEQINLAYFTSKAVSNLLKTAS